MSHHRRAVPAVLAVSLLVLGPVALVGSVAGPDAGSAPGGLRVDLASPTGPGRDPKTPVLRPGAALPLDVRLTNPYAAPVEVSGLRVRVARILPGDAVGCRAADFVAVDMDRARLRVAARSTATLSGAGVPSEEWPQLAMPASAAGSTGCEGLEVRLAFTATGRLW